MTAKNSFLLIISCVLLSFFTACQSDKQSPELLEAMEVHKQIIEVEKEVQQQLKEKGANLGDGDGLATQKLEELKSKYTTWQSNLVEVPGMEHDHHHHDHDGHDHNHDHDHGQELKITDAQMLEVQNSLLQELKEIQLALQKL